MNLLRFELKKPAPGFFYTTIPGEPKPWKRAGRSGKRTFNASAKDQEDIAWQFKCAFPRLKRDDGCVKYGMRFKFFFKRAVPGDIDNLTKNWGDGLQNLLWQNDQMVRELYAVMIPNHRPRTEVLIYQITDDYLAAAGEDS